MLVWAVRVRSAWTAWSKRRERRWRSSVSAAPSPRVAIERLDQPVQRGGAVFAAATTALARAGIPIGDARMVITGNARNPLVAVLAAATGIGEITRWSLDDAQDFPCAPCRAESMWASTFWVLPSPTAPPSMWNVSRSSRWMIRAVADRRRGLWR